MPAKERPCLQSSRKDFGGITLTAHSVEQQPASATFTACTNTAATQRTGKQKLRCKSEAVHITLLSTREHAASFSLREQRLLFTGVSRPFAYGRYGVAVLRVFAYSDLLYVRCIIFGPGPDRRIIALR